MPPEAARATLVLRRGTLRLSADVCRRHFAGCDGVALLPRGGRLLILPVAHAGGGGSILKVINARGDRGVAAADLFRELGLDQDLVEGDGQASFEAAWDDEQAALVVERFYPERAP